MPGGLPPRRPPLYEPTASSNIPFRTTIMQTGYQRFYCRLLAGVMAGALVGLAWHGTALAQAPAEDEKVAAAPAAAAASFDFLAVPEDEPWTAAVAAPVAGRGRVAGQIPLLIVLSSPPTREAEELVELAAPNLPLVLAAAAAPKLGRAGETIAGGAGGRIRSGQGQLPGGEAILGAAAAGGRGGGRRRRGHPLGLGAGGPVGGAAALAGAFGDARIAREGLAGVGRRGGLGGRCRRRPRPAMDQFTRPVQHQSRGAPGAPRPHHQGHRAAENPDHRRSAGAGETSGGRRHGLAGAVPGAGTQRAAGAEPCPQRRPGRGRGGPADRRRGTAAANDHHSGRLRFAGRQRCRDRPGRRQRRPAP